MALPDFSASKCSEEGNFYYGGTMDLSNSDDCQKVSGPEQKMEEKIAHSHSGATDMAGTGGASGNKVLDVADSCFYTGKNNEQILSIKSIKSNIPAIRSLKNIPSCGNNAYLENVSSASVTVLNADVGSKEVYQKATLFDRAGAMTSHCNRTSYHVSDFLWSPFHDRCNAIVR